MSLTQYLVRFICLVVFPLLLLGCGGGSSEPEASAPLLVNAGPDQRVVERSDVAFRATVAGGQAPYRYHWRAPSPLVLTLSDTQPETTSLVAPAVTTETEYEVQLTVTDASGASVMDTLVLTVVPDNIAPTAVITVTDVNDVSSHAFPAGVEVTLDASQSIDPDGGQNDLSFSWRQLSGASILENVVTSNPLLVFTTPILEAANSLSVELTVTDSEGASDRQTISLSVLSERDTLPTIEAVADYWVYSGETIGLAAEVGTSVPSALPLRLQWRQIAGPAVELTQSMPTYAFTDAPSVPINTALRFQLLVEDANNNAVEKDITVTVVPMPTSVINDTGVIGVREPAGTSYDAALLGQDGQRGSDRRWRNGQGLKAGEGDLSFDFTRLDDKGEQVDGPLTQWSCVRDNVTGLVWEVKSEQAGLHDQDNTYAWYQSASNGGDAGDVLGTNGSCSAAPCHIENFVQQVNVQGLCGFFDWRLPTHHEVMTLMHYGMDNALIDASFFPYPGTSQGPLWYWTTISAADGVNEEGAKNAWAIDLRTGVDAALPKPTAARVRLVRAGR